MINTPFRVCISPKFKEEKKYVFDVLFHHFYKIDNYQLEISDKYKEYEIHFNETRILVKDIFFKQIEGDTYLDEKYLPRDLSYVQSTEDRYKIPVLYGESTINKSNRHVEFSCDIIGTIFFFLSRWEEYISSDLDKHGRFKGENSFAVKNNIFRVPVVDIYADFLWRLFSDFTPTLKKDKTSVSLHPSHDIDFFVKWPNKLNYYKTQLGNLIKRSDKDLFLKDKKAYSVSNDDISKDPFFTYKLFMDDAESRNRQATFYFMVGGNTNYDNNYDINDENIAALLSEIKLRGHRIGLHPGYNASTTSNQLKKEIEIFKNVCGVDQVMIRQHFLKINLIETINIWEDAGVQYDSSFYYNNHPGFRAGCSVAFPLFNVTKHKKTNILEDSVSFMDTDLLGESPRIIKEVKEVYEATKYVGTNFKFLWHNSSFYGREWKPFHSVYSWMINDFDDDYLGNHNFLSGK